MPRDVVREVAPGEFEAPPVRIERSRGGASIVRTGWHLAAWPRLQAKPVTRCYLRHARGTSRMHRARRVARTCGSRGDPHPPGDDDDEHLVPRRRLREGVAA